MCVGGGEGGGFRVGLGSAKGLRRFMRGVGAKGLHLGAHDTPTTLPEHMVPGRQAHIVCT